MTDLSRISGGQPVGLCPKAPTDSAAPDKWAVLDAATRGAEELGLNHRTLAVLRALLSFLPGRALPRTSGAAVVYPSNRTLSHRLNGMPESTLRRHLATLVRLGLIARQDSANRKRFARFGGLAFGFDLGPLAHRADDLRATADRAERRAQEVSALRARLAATRQRLLEAGSLPADTPLMEEARLTLRRKAGIDKLRQLCDALEPHLDNTARLPCPAEEMDGRHSENERHIQKTVESESVRRPAVENPGAAELPPLAQVLEKCHEYRSYFPDTPPDWPGLIRVADRLHQMMGIDRQVYETASAVIGPPGTATVILCMLEHLPRIHRPGAYLRGLVQRAKRGALNLAGMLRSVGRSRVAFG